MTGEKKTKMTEAMAKAEKTAAKADLAASLEQMTGEKKTKMTEAMAKAEFIKDLHLECDWLTSNFQIRKEARAGEIDSLKKAKAVLSGADYSLLQARRTLLRRSSLRSG